MPPRNREDRSLRFATRRNALLFLAPFFLIFGAGTGSRPLVISGLFVLILLAIQWRKGSAMLRDVRVRRLHCPRSFEGEEVLVNLEIENRNTTAVHLLDISDCFPPSGNYNVRTVAPLVPAESSVPYRYRQVCTHRRGIYLIGPITLRGADELGLFSFQMTCEEVTRLLVYPQAHVVRGFRVLGHGTHLDIGEEVVRRIGRSEQFAGVRAYRPGDPPRLIHWPTSTRLDSLYVKEFDQSAVTEVTIYCDLFLLSLAGLGALTSVEYRIKAAASIASEAIRKNHFVKLVGVKAPVEATRMAGGQGHLISILDRLALLRAEGEGAFEDVLIDSARLLRHQSTAVLLMSSVHVDVEKLDQALRLFGMYKVRVIAVVVDDHTFLKLREEQVAAFRDAPPLEDLVRRLKLADCTVFTIANLQDAAARLGIPA